MITPEVRAILHERTQIKFVVFCCIEASLPYNDWLISDIARFSHKFCVLQSALDFMEAGYNVHLVADGVSSSSKEEIPSALARIR
ncbi:hypothetical protein BDR03DRAFT_972407 [Suillus americanus]|nr:hypothetical protein BDR03DRAFT_972407 [Suillus americanus]